MSEQNLGWHALMSDATETHRIEGGVVATFPADLAGCIDDLIVAEAACCSSLSISIERTVETVRLIVTTDDRDGSNAIANLFGLDL